MAEPTTIPAEPDWWRARDRQGDLWYREPVDDEAGGSVWVVSTAGPDGAEWLWAEAWEAWGPLVCADDEAVDHG